MAFPNVGLLIVDLKHSVQKMQLVNIAFHVHTPFHPFPFSPINEDSGCKYNGQISSLSICLTTDSSISESRGPSQTKPIVFIVN